MKKKPIYFRHAFIYVGLLMIINIIAILLNLKIHSEHFVFFINLIAVSFIFPYVVLFSEKKERFSPRRYIYFVFSTFIALFIICNLFIYRMI